MGLLTRREQRKEAAAPPPQHPAETYKSLALKALLEQLLRHSDIPIQRHVI